MSEKILKEIGRRMGEFINGCLPLTRELSAWRESPLSSYYAFFDGIQEVTKQLTPAMLQCAWVLTTQSLEMLELNMREYNVPIPQRKPVVKNDTPQ